MTHTEIVSTLFMAGVICVFLAVVVFLGAAPTATDAGLNFRRATRQAAVVAKPKVKVAARASVPLKVIYCEITAYSPAVAETDGNPYRTASGKTVYVGGIAADLRILPFGSRVIIPGYNGGKPCTVIDTGGAIHGNKLDVFFWYSHEAVHWGRRHNVPVQVLFIPKGGSS